MTLKDNGFRDSYLARIGCTINRGPSSEHRAMAIWKEPSHARKSSMALAEHGCVSDLSGSTPTAVIRYEGFGSPARDAT